MRVHTTDKLGRWAGIVLAEGCQAANAVYVGDGAVQALAAVDVALVMRSDVVTLAVLVSRGSYLARLTFLSTAFSTFSVLAWAGAVSSHPTALLVGKRWPHRHSAVVWQ